MLFTRLAFASSVLLWFLQWTYADRCPFNAQECKCLPTVPPQQYTYKRVECTSTSTTLPAFTPEGDEVKYTVTDSLTIQGDVSSIEARSFSAFQAISTLALVQISNSSQPVYQRWNDEAFVDVQVLNLEVKGLDGLIPLPKAVQQLGGCLRRLVVSNGRLAVDLGEGTFGSLSSLKAVWITQTNISRMSDGVFAGLEQGLEELILNGANLTTFPGEPLQRLKKLKRLGLNRNDMKTLPDNPLGVVPTLESLSLGGNPLNETIAQGALDQVPPGLTQLFLDSTGLEAVPGGVLKNRALTVLSLSNNDIEAIAKSDFEDGAGLEMLNMNTNPIANIEPGAFSDLKNLTLLDLRNTNMTSIDLAALAASDGMRGLYLDDNIMLVFLTVSDTQTVGGRS